MKILMKREINENIQRDLSPFISDIDNFFYRFETQLETELIKLFNSVGISALVKTDKYSLPHQGEVVVKLKRESYIPGMYEKNRIFRPIIKEMLDEDAYKIRFYIHAETYGGDEEGLFGMYKSGFKYSFRYYIH